MISVCGPQIHIQNAGAGDSGFCSEGPRTGVEYDARDPSMTEVLGVLRIATRAL